MPTVFSKRDISDMKQALAGIEACGMVTEALFTENSLWENREKFGKPFVVPMKDSILFLTDLLLDERGI